MRSASGVFFLAVFALLSPSHASHATGTRSETYSPDICEVNQPPTCEYRRLTHITQIDPKATVSDACASYSTLDSLNREVSPILKSITQSTDFFAYYRLNLFNKQCTFWSDANSMCGNIACAVNTLDNEEDIPPIWRVEELSKLEGPKAVHPGRAEQKARPKEKPLQGMLGDDVGESCVVEYDDECDERDYCVPEDEGATSKGDYVSLVDNQERFTGYSGPWPHQVWDAIYRENCFSKPPQQASSFGRSLGFGGLQASKDLRNVMQDYSRQQAGAGDADDLYPLDDECLEKRVFYRVISGMHASISTHLCWDYLNQTTGKWGPNLQCYKDRLHDHPERISNLYFNYALVLRAVAKIRKHLEHYTFCSGDPPQDFETKEKVLALADKIRARPKIFDESIMFQDPSVVELKEDFRNRFRNVSRLMDCVGCDKCRLWGKVQTAGYGAAMKILFEFDETKNGENPLLRRTELVALVNTLDRISHSLASIQKFRALLEIDTVQRSKGKGEGGRYDFDDESEEEEYTVHQPETISEAFWNEWYLVWRTYTYVMRSWIGFPRKA
jgi:ERO1-like protein beta